LLILISKGKKF